MPNAMGMNKKIICQMGVFPAWAMQLNIPETVRSAS
jgi:hypothetical protein